MKSCIMQLASLYSVMFLCGVCVRSQDPPSLNSPTNATTPPCAIQMGDVPGPRCAVDIDVPDYIGIDYTILLPSTTESVSDSTRPTFTPKPAGITPTVPPSLNSPEDTKLTKTQKRSPSTLSVTVPKNQPDERNATESPNCTFDPCVHLQNTCFNRPDPKCVCPGVTSKSRPPNSTSSIELTAVTHSVVLVKWCAPYSPVQEYLLVVRHQGLAQRNLSFSSAVRQVFISDLTAESSYRVCVQAVNRAGASGPECASVWTGANTLVYLYGLLVVCVVLTAVVATLSFCLYKQCKKLPVENPHLTRLISIPNPAFFNP